MNLKRFLLAFAIASPVFSYTQSEDSILIKLAFGSCLHQDKPTPLLEKVVEMKPDAFVFLGDNIYGDTRDMQILQAKYDQLNANSSFQKLKVNVPLFAVWDDHDYGENDAGRHYPMKRQSEILFLDFWGISAESERRKHEGTYDRVWLKNDGVIIQLILLDTRYFRDDLVLREKKDEMGKNDYKPNPSADSTFLGEDQWKWLESVLKEKADLRIIASSNQFSHTYNGWESWNNVPHERNKMINLIKSTKANGVVIISGDVHWGEISKLEVEKGYPLYDITSSGITQTWPDTEPNKNRVGSVIRKNNIGTLTLVKNKEKGLSLIMELHTASKNPKVKHEVRLQELRF